MIRSFLTTFMVIIAIAGIYAGAYLAIVRPTRWSVETIEVTHPEYRIESDILVPVFAPAVWLDRRIRPTLWQTTIWDKKTFKRVPMDFPLFP